MNIRYVIIAPLLESSLILSSEDRAKSISHEWRKLNISTWNKHITTQYLMPSCHNNVNVTEFCICMDLDFMLNVSKGFNTDYLFELYDQDLIELETAAINTKINAAVGSKVALFDLIPTSWILHDKANMINLGWFESEPA